ncbi:hypothetical protein COHA_009994 [Chlorella ohadii]|uniref:Uncharacterized protein n=1 Tax=Chlorella ohadii TaxID=2649997 RepID=A0AAD5DII3_9CHLO|nr:hypothetical protein COHA_009994 [Chlorella ohadii]
MRGWLAPFAAHTPVQAALPLLDEMRAWVPQAVQWPALAVKVLRDLLNGLAKLRKHLGCERTAAWAAQRVLDLVSRGHTCFGAVPLLDEGLDVLLLGCSGLGTCYGAMLEHAPLEVGLRMGLDDTLVPAVASFSGPPPPWASSSAAAVAARVNKALIKASPAVAAELEALMADVAGADDGQRLLAALSSKHGPRLLRLVALLAFDAKRLASGLDALSSLGVYPRHLATAKSGTVQIPGQPAVRSPLQIKYELLAQLLDDTTLPMGLSYLGVLEAAPPAEEADASLGEQCASCGGYLLEAVKSLYRISVPLGLDSSVGATLLTMQDACHAVQQAAAQGVAMQHNTERVEVRSTTAQIEGSMARGLAEVQQQVGGLQQQIGGLHAELQRVAAAAEHLAAAQRDVAARRERALLEAEESMLNLQIDYLARKRDHVTRLLEQVSRRISPSRSLQPAGVPAPAGAAAPAVSVGTAGA